MCGRCFVFVTELLVDYNVLITLRLACCIFLHCSIADHAQSQHTLNPKAKEFRPSFGASQRLQTNGSNRYALYFTLLCTMDFNYLQEKNEVLYVIGVLYLCVGKDFLSEIHISL